MTTAKDIYRGALARFGMNSPDGLIGPTNDETVLAAYNDGLMEFYVDHDWVFSYTEATFTTVANNDTYSPPSNWSRTAWMTAAGGYPLSLKSRREHKDYLSTGMPRWYDTQGDRILLCPVPDGAYQITHAYYAAPERIVRDSDTYADVEDQLDAEDVQVPDIYVPLLTLYVAKNLAVVALDREAHSTLREEINQYRARVADNRRRHTTPGRIKARRDY